jgi:hypothetical protein
VVYSPKGKLKTELRVLSFEPQGGFDAKARGCLLTVSLNSATKPSRSHVMHLGYQLHAVDVHLSEAIFAEELRQRGALWGLFCWGDDLGQEE